MKKCRTCGRELPLSEFHSFYKKNRKSITVMAHCKECYRKNVLEKYHKLTIEEKRDRKKRANLKEGYHKAYKLKNLYDLTLEEYNDMISNQNSKCYICDKHITGSDIRIDHDHTTGKVRKLLCNNCNGGLGFLNDDINIVKKCVEYLKEHGNV